MAAQDDAAVAEAHRALLADSSIQFQLARFLPPETPDWMRRLVAFIRDNAEVLRIIFWILLAAVALAILYLIARRLMGADWPWARKREDEDQGENLQPDRAAARQLLSEADALASEGNYSEAAHLLLFRSIEDIDSRRPDVLRPALTSRDIAGLGVIPSRPRQAFSTIVMMVERSLFGGRRLALEDWSRCRSAYEEFALAEGWRR